MTGYLGNSPYVWIFGEFPRFTGFGEFPKS